MLEVMMYGKLFSNGYRMDFDVNSFGVYHAGRIYAVGNRVDTKEEFSQRGN